MVTGHPHLALTPLGTGCAVGPREAGWESTCAHYHLSLAFQASLLPLSLWYSSPRPAHRLTFIAPGSPPAGLTLTAARHVVATRTMDAVATLLTALSKESLGTGFGQNTYKGKLQSSESRNSILLCCDTEMLANAGHVPAERNTTLASAFKDTLARNVSVGQIKKSHIKN